MLIALIVLGVAVALLLIAVIALEAAWLSERNEINKKIKRINDCQPFGRQDGDRNAIEFWLIEGSRSRDNMRHHFNKALENANYRIDCMTKASQIHRECVDALNTRLAKLEAKDEESEQPVFGHFCSKEHVEKCFDLVEAGCADKSKSVLTPCRDKGQCPFGFGD